MLTKKMQDAINEQIKNEFYSGYLYLAMAAYFDSAGLAGLAHWMRVQSKEELSHGLKLFDYVNERGGRVVLEAIDRPQVEFESVRQVFEMTLEHERKVTALINGLYELALAEKDYASQVLLHWFIEEQVEEESSASQILDTLELAGDQGQALVMLDRALARRGE